MSEPTPLWSMDKWWHEVQHVKGTAKIAGNNVDYIELADADELFEKIIADYEQRIHELEAELARLREQGQWEPLPDGNYDGLEVSANGSEIGLSTHDVHGIQWPVDHWLSDDIRLCRKVAAPMHPFEEGYSHHQFNVPVSRDTLGALEAVLAGETSVVRDVVRVWLDRAWHTINGEWPERNPDAQPQPASVPDGEVLDWLKRLVLAKENEMLCYIQRYNYEDNSTQLATCRAALAWLDAQSPQATAPDNDARD